tara:strand:+ start:87416 stop:89140 length:1725 start_codon:yes stop_codon:yes gene_type:complete
LLFLPHSSFAKTYTVLGDRIELPYDKSSSQTYVIEQDELATSGSLNQALAKVPGLFVSQSGAYGGNTTYFMRGQGRGQVKVIIDGVEINDPTDIDRSVQLQHFALSHISRIEVIKGAQGALYGADSAGGVILITTKRDQHSSMNASYGSHETWSGGFYTSAKQGDFSVRASGDLISSEGISAYNDARVSGHAEKDFYKRTMLNLGVSNKNLGLDVNVKSINSKGDIDSSFSGDIVNNDLSRYDHMIYGLSHETPLIDGLWSMKSNLSYSTITRDVQTNHFEGSSIQAGLEAKLLYAQSAALAIFSDYKVDAATASSEFSQKDQEAYGLGLTHHLNHELFFSDQSIRIDKAQAYDSTVSGRLGVGKNLTAVQTIKLQVASGFKAPTLYQRYTSFGGNQDLNATKTYSLQTSYALSLEQASYEVTAFSTKATNAIDYDLNSSRYFNIGKTKTYGLELANWWKFSALKLWTNYTWQRARNDVTGADLARQPRWFGTLGASYQFSKNFEAEFSHEAVSKRNDSGKLPYYDTYNISLLWLKNTTTFKLTLNNIFDRNYEPLRFYAPAGRIVNLYASWSL